MEELLTSAGIISVVSLTFMEVILGIDNIIFVSIVAGRVEKKDQKRARNLGLLLAMLIRIGLLFIIQLIIQAQQTLFTLPLDFEGKDISIKDLVLIAGGLFLIYKSTTEIHHKFNVDDHKETESKTKQKFKKVVIQILMLNIVFSVDSIVTAIGLTQNITIMMIAVILSMLIMLAVSSTISNFVEKHPTVKMLALSFLLMIGFMLIVEAFEIHVPKGYVYFAMAFSLFVEMLNIRLKVKRKTMIEAIPCHPANEKAQLKLGMSLRIHHHFQDALPEWRQLVPENHHLLSRDMQAIEDSNPPDIELLYVSIYKGSELTGVMYLQHLTFSQNHFNKDLIKHPVLKFFKPILSKLKAHLLICGNLFRVNFQGFYFKDKNDRIDIFDCLNLFRRQMKRVNFSGILVKDCKREFEQSGYSCFRFSPFRQDLTMEMAIRKEWKNFDEYIAALSKKYRQRAIKIRKSLDGVERKYLTLDEIIFYKKDIEDLYMNVVNKQSLALGILGKDYFIEMKKQLKDNFELVAFIKDGKLLAFSGHIYYPLKNAMELHYIGFDYSVNQLYNLYFNIIFDGIETAILKKYDTLEMGRTAREAKASAGAKAVENFNYIWVKAGLPRLAVNFLSEKFEDKMGEDWQNRNPFKEVTAVPAI